MHHEGAGSMDKNIEASRQNWELLLQDYGVDYCFNTNNVQNC